MNKKILDYEKAKKLIKKLKKEKKKIVMCHGVFDLLHIGHINHFEESKRFAHKLIVSVTSNNFVNKGPGRPVFDERVRMEAIASLTVVDYVILSDHSTAKKNIQLIKPNFLSKGPDYKDNKSDLTGQIYNEIRELKKYKGKIVYTKKEKFSSSKLLNQSSFSQISEHQKLISQIKKKYNFLDIQKIFKKISKLKVLVIGEIIIDDYIFCEALGKSGKEPVLALKKKDEEKYLGGAGAISNHVSNFTKNVKLLGMVGEKNEFKKFIMLNLNKNIKVDFFTKKNSPTILKKRFLDSVTLNKMLGVYEIEDNSLSEPQEKKLRKKILSLLPKFDVVIVSDYGHGFISSKNSNLINKHASFLALNAQVNAANIGHHSLKKYKNIDAVIINENELKHELRDKSKDIRLLMKKLSNERNIKKLITTSGKNGSYILNKQKNKFLQVKAFEDKVIDKIGAGDAMLSILALVLKVNVNEDLSLLIGNLAGAQSIKSIGNKKNISKNNILKSLDHLIK